MSPALLKTVLRVPVLGRLLAPAWFDEARVIVQRPAFSRVLGGRRLGGRVLNAGCGEGLYAPFIEQFHDIRQIVNMDIHQPRVSRGREDPRHRDQQGSLDALPFTGAAFDAIVCTEVLEHVPADLAAVTELARVLKPGGTLLMSVPTPPAPFDRAHVREGYSLADLSAMLAAAGFDVVGSERCLHALMRAAYVAWQWQARAAGRNLFPRALLRSAAHLDRAFRLGAPWDLVIAAVKRPPGARQ
jgi:SAM-dependent methyltransferase